MIDSLSPALLILIPAFLLAQRSRAQSLSFFLLCAPCYVLIVFAISGERLLLPYLATIGLILHQCIRWVRTGRTVVFNRGIILLWAFLGVELLSALYLVVAPPEVMIHPFSVGGFINRELIPLSASRFTITQFLHRAFVVLAITTLCAVLTTDRIIGAIRWIIRSGIVVGFVGVLYQITTFFDIYAVSSFFRWLGFKGFLDVSRGFGPVQRMYSLPGEPGYTASYLLFAFALAVTFVVIDEKNGAIQKREAKTASILLAGFLAVNISGTGYGGLLIFLAVMFFVIVLLAPNAIWRSIKSVLAITTVALAFGGIIFLITGIDLLYFVQYQSQKLLFEAGSGILRIWYAQQTFSAVITHRPLLGLGPGSFRVPMALFGIFAETGLVGLLFFIGAHVLAFRNTTRLAIQDDNKLRPVAIALLVAGVTLFLTILFAKSLTGLRFPWYWLSFAMAASLNMKVPDSV